MCKLKRECSGFSILELLIVIVIIGILATIALPKYMDIREDATIAVSKSNLKSLQTGIERYYLDMGVYPEKLADLVAKGLIKKNTCYLPGSTTVYQYGKNDVDFLVYDATNDLYATSEILTTEFSTYSGGITPSAQTL